MSTPSLQLYRLLQPIDGHSAGTIWEEANDVDYVIPRMKAVRMLTDSEGKQDSTIVMIPSRYLKPLS